MISYVLLWKSALELFQLMQFLAVPAIKAYYVVQLQALQLYTEVPIKIVVDASQFIASPFL